MLISQDDNPDYYSTYTLEDIVCHSFDKLDTRKILYTLLISLAEHGSRDIQLNILNNLLPDYVEIRR